MNRHTLYIAIAAGALAACDSVAPEDRLVDIKPTDSPVDTTEADSLGPVARSVLLVDFTGQRCVNCPRGSAIIQQMEQAYGERLIAVGMYSGGFGNSPSGKPYPLTTSEGNEYFSHWQLNEQPIGVVDYQQPTPYTDWNYAVRQRMQADAPLKLDISSATIDAEGQGSVTVSAIGAAGTTAGRLQLWLLEDSITGVQVRHDPIDNDLVTINDTQYLHRHVFRRSLNGTWGQDLTVAQGDTATVSTTFAADATWDKGHLSVVAFVYNEAQGGVQQACRSNVTRGN